MEADYRFKAMQMAVEDFDTFCKFAGVNNEQLTICIERAKGLSLERISRKLSIKKSKVQFVCDKCFDKKKSV